jgi:hypothetical protein
VQQHHFICYESPLNEFILATINELVALLRAFVTILNNTRSKHVCLNF